MQRPRSRRTTSRKKSRSRRHRRICRLPSEKAVSLEAQEARGPAGDADVPEVIEDVTVDVPQVLDRPETLDHVEVLDQVEVIAVPEIVADEPAAIPMLTEPELADSEPEC